MSACISQHGEYSSHELDTDLRCKLCGVLDEDALLSRARNAWHALAFVDQTSYANRDSRPDLPWRNDEVMALLDDIRAALIIGPEKPETFADRMYRQSDDAAEAKWGVRPNGTLPKPHDSESRP